MKKDKIAIGQCYDLQDKIYMIVEGPYMDDGDKMWVVKNTLSKETFKWAEKNILLLRRCFFNWE